MTTAPAQLPHRHIRHPLALGVLGVAVGAAIAVGIVLLVRGNGTSSPGTIRGSGTEVVQGRTVAPFHSVELAAANNVVVYVGGPQSVAVRADDNLIRFVTTRVRNGTLEIGQTRSFSTQAPTGVEISVPSLDAVTLSGAGSFSVAGVKATHFVVRVPGSGTLTVTGRTATLDATLAGAADVRLEQLVAGDVIATVAGAGTLRIDATRSLDATVSGVGAIVYRGDPAKVEAHTTGLGSISRG